MISVVKEGFKLQQASFGDVAVGEAFECGDALHIKTGLSSSPLNAWDVTNKGPRTFSTKASVLLVDASITYRVRQEPSKV